MPKIRKISPMPTTKFISSDLGAVVQNTWYTAFSGTNVNLLGLSAKITVADETVSLRITVDGVLVSADAAKDLLFGSNHSTYVGNNCYSNDGGAAYYFSLSAPTNSALMPDPDLRWVRGRSVLVEARKTTAAGASHILIAGIYEQW